MSIPQYRMIFSNAHYVITNIWALCFVPYLNLQNWSQMFSINQEEKGVFEDKWLFFLSVLKARPVLSWSLPLHCQVQFQCFVPHFSVFQSTYKAAPTFRSSPTAWPPSPTHSPIRSYAPGTLSWHRANQCLILLLKAACLALKQPISMNRVLFDLTESTIYITLGKHADHHDHGAPIFNITITCMC